MAVRTVSNTGGNWNATTAWAGGVVPILGDTVDFTATSGNLVVNVSTANLAGIDFTNYLGTITVNNNINIQVGITNLGTGGYTQLGTNGLILIGISNTITSNGTVWSRPLTFSGISSTITLSDDLYVTGNILFQSAALYTLNGNSLYVGGNLTMGANGTLGTTTIIFNGTGTWLNTGAIAGIKNNLTIDTLGTLTVSGNVYYQTGILTYIAGTVVSTGSVLNIVNSTTINTSGMTWRDVAVSTNTVTLTSDLNTEVLRMNGNGNAIVNNSGGNIFTLTLIQAGAGILQGTASINLIGTGTWIHTSVGVIRNNVNINTSGTLTISGSIFYNTGTLTYILGTVITTGSTLNIGASTTLNTNGITWNNINPTAIITLLSDLYFSGLFENSIAVGFTINGFNIYCMSGKLSGVGNGVSLGGTTTFIFKGNSTWFTIYSGFLFDINIIIDCDTLTLPINNTNQYAPFGPKTLTYLKGNMNKNSHLILNNSCTLLNFNKCIIDNIIVGTGASLITMNEFFSGSPNKTVNLRHSVSSSTYTIAFQDGFEKISKFVNISNCTLSKPLQLLVITKSKLNSRNSGIRYINQSPNGIAKGEPSVNQTTFGAAGLLPDPIKL